MTSIPVPGTRQLPRIAPPRIAPPKTAQPRVQVSPEAISAGRLALVVGITLFLALAAYYFIGVDEGMTSVFGRTLMIHEWVHDSRHFLGFPCH